MYLDEASGVGPVLALRRLGAARDIAQRGKLGPSLGVDGLLRLGFRVGPGQLQLAEPLDPDTDVSQGVEGGVLRLIGIGLQVVQLELPPADELAAAVA